MPGALVFQSDIVRSGRSAARLTLHEGDQIPEERGSLLERAELVESNDQWIGSGTTYRYAFSLFLP